MNRLAESVLDDGVICSCWFDAGKESKVRDAIFVIEVNGIAEFGCFMRWVPKPALSYASVSGSFIRLADADDLAKQAGNQEAMARARLILLKWIADGRRSFQTLRMRFSVRRERLSLMMHVSESMSFQPIVDVLEKRFQTKVSITMVSPREISSLIGGIGVCGCNLCCSNGVCERSSVDVKMAKQQSIPLHDSVATGLCGKLKCCIGYELEQSSLVGNSIGSEQ